MIGSWPLDWATLAISLFNFLLLIWLSITVFLNANRRDWGVWLMSGGLMTGAIFFICHTAILGDQEVLAQLDGLNFWWHAGWIPVILAPLAWYVVMLWYSGFWDDQRSPLYRKHNFWLVSLLVLSIVLIVLFVFSNAIPEYDQLIKLDLSGTVMVGNTPAFFLLVPVFMLSCIFLSLRALLHPAPTKHSITEQARQRSRPWLLGTTIILLMVCFLVGAFIAYIAHTVSNSGGLSIQPTGIALFDLVLLILIAIATILLGQAIVSYEVFTGKALPRRTLTFRWRTAILISISCSVLVSGSLVFNLQSIYSFVLLTLFLIISYAFYTWRSFVDKEQFTAQLRPFVTSEQLTDRFVSLDFTSGHYAQDLFDAVCRNVLSTQQAQLTAVGAFAPLAGPSLVFPVSRPPFTMPQITAAGNNIQALDPLQEGGYCWSVPLWAERGLMGTFLIGQKLDKGLYTQEEMEIAQASGERIIDMLVAEQMAAKLMQLQRQRLAETQIMDFRTRRLLHDDVLPSLHSTLLQLSSSAKDNPGVQNAIASLIAVHGQIADLIHTSSLILPKDAEAVDLVSTLQKTVNTEFANEFESISWCIEPIQQFDKTSSEIILGAVREVVRNAAIHGRGIQLQRLLHLNISIRQAKSVELVIWDDGVGLNGSLPASQGSGNGLSLHGTLLAIIGGQLVAEPLPSGGTQVIISVPVRQSTL